MAKLFIVTGACGHLGSTLVRLLHSRGERVRGLMLPTEGAIAVENVEYFVGDVRDKESLRPLFENAGDAELYVLHTAGIVDISGEFSSTLYDVNVNGTRNLVELCRQYRIKRLLYVSSVHAIPEKDSVSVLQEVDQFSADRVVGGYAKTKAEATQAVLEAARTDLNAVVVHPSGILGPFDGSGNHMVQLVVSYLRGKLPACVKGGYDFVDVRDVALGCLLALERGRRGECYILSNRHYEIRELLDMLRQIAGGRRLPVLPLWMARAASPLLQYMARRRRERPLFTRYSLYTLSSNDRFSHDKATCELGYRPRDLFQTLRDTVAWLREKGPRAGKLLGQRRLGGHRGRRAAGPLSNLT